MFLPTGGVKLGEEDLSRGDVSQAQPRPLGAAVQGRQEVVFAFLQHVLLDEGAGGDDPDDLPVHQALGLGGVLSLLADGDLVPLGDEPGDIGLGGVIRHAAHGRALLRRLVPVPGGQGEVEFGGGGLRVVVEHLVKVPQAEKEQAVGVLALDL